MIKDQQIQEITTPLIKDLIIQHNYRSPAYSPINIILEKERAVHGKIHGLFTALGTFWEKLAKELALHNNFEVLDHKIFKKPANAPINQASVLDGIITSRLNRTNEYNATTSKKAVFNFCQYFLNNPCDEWERPSSGTGVDVYLKKGRIHYLFDTKTTQPNLAGLQSFLRQLHHWYWYGYSRFPDDEIYARIVFPYNPYDTPFEQNLIGGGQPISHKEEWLDPKLFWEIITDNPNSYKQIIDSFKIASSDPDILNFLEEIFPETR